VKATASDKRNFLTSCRKCNLTVTAPCFLWLSLQVYNLSIFKKFSQSLTPLQLGQNRRFIWLAVTSTRTDARTSEMWPERSAGNTVCCNECVNKCCDNTGNRKSGGMRNDHITFAQNWLLFSVWELFQTKYYARKHHVILSRWITNGPRSCNLNTVQYYAKEIN